MTCAGFLMEIYSVMYMSFVLQCHQLREVETTTKKKLKLKTIIHFN